MGHNIEYYDYSENKSKREITDELDEYVKHRTWEEGSYGLPCPINWIDKVCNTREEAIEYIKSVDNGQYNQIAVKYKDCKEYGKATKDLKTRVSEARSKAYAAEHKVHYADVKAEFITCHTCGSKLARKYLHSNYCPMCRYDMRPESALQKIARLNEIVSELEAKFETAKRKDAQKKNGPIKWLVKIEYHT